MYATIDLLGDEQYGERYRAWVDLDLPLADICSRLRDEHIGDELHPNEAGAKIIAEEIFKLLAPTHKAWQELPKE